MKGLLIWLWLSQGADVTTTAIALHRGCVERTYWSWQSSHHRSQASSQLRLCSRGALRVWPMAARCSLARLRLRPLPQRC
jgi:hypothetical protein